ncbi:MAG: RNA-binding protein [Nanoarchaeota archaeon]
MTSMMHDHITALLQKEMREDGRKPLEYRKPIKVEYDISPKSAEGSARVTMGDTIVVAGVKLEVGAPFPDSQDEGNLMVNVELTPLSNPDYELGPPSPAAIEYARVVDRALREGHALDTKKLCIKEGEKVWTVIIDLYPINDAGNLFDAFSLAALAALKNANFPTFDKKTEKIDYKKKTKTPLPLDHMPLEVTVLKINGTYVVDPTIEEWKSLDARLTVGLLENGMICAMQKGGPKGLTTEDIGKMIDIAAEHTAKLRKLL